jgi:hypothetical protein
MRSRLAVGVAVGDLCEGGDIEVRAAQQHDARSVLRLGRAEPAVSLSRTRSTGISGKVGYQPMHVGVDMEKVKI